MCSVSVCPCSDNTDAEGRIVCASFAGVQGKRSYPSLVITAARVSSPFANVWKVCNHLKGPITLNSSLFLISSSHDPPVCQGISGSVRNTTIQDAGIWARR